MIEKAALFISTLNEIEGIKFLFDKIQIYKFDEFYVLDGGSTDGTIEFFEENNIPVIHNVRKGEIFNKAASVTKCENLVFFAPDGNENPYDILMLLEGLNNGNDMVIASRFMKGGRNEEEGRLFPLRLWVNRIFTFLVKVIWKGNLTDTINGFRAVKRSKILEMELEPTGFDIEFQMSIRALKLNYNISEIPTIENERVGGASTAYSIPTGILMLKRILKELFIKTV